MDTPPPPSKKLRQMTDRPAAMENNADSSDGAADVQCNAGQQPEKQLHFVAKKSAGSATSTFDMCMAEAATVGDLRAHLAEREGCDPALITIVCRGAVLSQATTQLLPITTSEGSNSKTVIVYIVRKPTASTAKPAGDKEAQATSGTPTSEAAASNEASSALAPGPETASSGRRVLLLLRHGQCCHEDEHDELKALTAHGHQQAEETARYIAQLFEAERVPRQRALLHSTSRRARETAAKLPQHLPGLDVWNADLLRETDPTKNPLRAEEVFQRLFAAPMAGASDTLIVVAHNNIILYLLMRAAGVPIERAAQAWNLFLLRHTSVTRVDVAVSGAKQIVSVGAAGHIPHANVTWNNIAGADMAAWKGGGAERRKFSGRMVVLVRQVASTAKRRNVQIDAVAAHIKGLSEYMISGHSTVTCTAPAQETAAAIAQQFGTRLRLLPDSISDHPEAAFLQFFNPPVEHGRDTVVMVAEDATLLYWLLRALHMSQDEAKAMIASYCISHASVTLLNIRTDRSMKVVTVGDTGHLPLDCVE